ncbi:MAG TPA: hypothetical protein VFC74_02985 [Oscillospiraceae bacterium]|nr:hypothetical protein [Oscillospiraceae bacterium]
MRLLTLIKMQLNVSFNWSALKWYAKHDKKKILGGIALLLFILVSLAPVYYFLAINFLETVYLSGYSLGQPEFILTFAIVAVSMLVLFFAIPFIMATFYFSRDLALLVPLPFLPHEIIGAKFSTVVIQEYLTVLPFMLPALYFYGTGQNAGPYFWLVGILLTLLLPIIPLAIISAAILFLMRVTNLGKRKDLLRYLGMMLMLAAVLGFNYFMTKLEPMTQEELMNLLFAKEGLATLISRVYPPALWATRALAAEGTTALLNLAMFVILTSMGVMLTLYLGDRLFYRGLIGGDEVTARRDISVDRLAKAMSQVSSPAWAIAKREIKVLLRTPIYFFNSVAVILIMPLAMFLPLIWGNAMEPILTMLETLAPLYLNLGAAASIALVAAFAPAASTSFSREGKQFWLSQVMPVVPQEQINGKIIYSLLLSLLGIPLVFLASFLLFHWTNQELILISLVGMFLTLPSITVSLLIDLLRPYLTWSNPQAAIKQNFNAVFGMVATGVLYYLMYQFAMYMLQQQYSDFVIYSGVVASSLLLAALPYGIMVKIAERRFREIIAP